VGAGEIFFDLLVLAVLGNDFSELGVLLPEEATLFVASSMPVRDIETFWPVRPDPPRVLCNRGANGIDGTVSSAFGAAAESSGPVVLLIGDVAHHPCQMVHGDWCSTIDFDPAQTIRTRNALFSRFAGTPTRILAGILTAISTAHRKA